MAYLIQLDSQPGIIVAEIMTQGDRWIEVYNAFAIVPGPQGNTQMIPVHPFGKISNPVKINKDKIVMLSEDKEFDKELESIIEQYKAQQAGITIAKDTKDVENVAKKLRIVKK